MTEKEPDFQGSEFVGYPPRSLSPNATDKSRSFLKDELWVLTGVLLGAALVSFDFFVTLVTLPTVQRYLGASYPELQMMVAAYAAVVAAGLIAGGRLGDTFGPKRIYLLGLIISIISSFFAAYSSNPFSVICARALQGLAIALIQPQVISTLGVLFSGHRRRKAFAAYSISQALGGIAGQLSAGALIEANLYDYGWRLCFIVTIPISLTAFIVTLLFHKPQSKLTPLSIDWVGMTLCALTLLWFSWTMTLGRHLLSTELFWINLAGSLFVLTIFTWQQFRNGSRDGTSMLPVDILNKPRIQLGLLCVFLFYLGIMPFYWLLSMRTQHEMAMPAWNAGLVFATFGIAFMVSTLFSPVVGRRLREWTLTLGASLLAVGHLTNAVGSHLDCGMMMFIGSLIISGLGIGLVMAPLLAMVTSGVNERHAGVLAGVVGTVQSAANSIGASVIPIIYLAQNSRTDGPIYTDGFTSSMLLLAAIAIILALTTKRAARSLSA